MICQALVAIAAGLTVTAAVSVQAQTTDEAMLRLATMRGYRWAPDSVRQQILQDPRSIPFLMSVLDGRTVVDSVDTVATLSWLAESGDPAALPRLLAHAQLREKSDIGSFPVAVYGLARLAPDIGIARQRLEDIAIRGQRREQFFLAVTLMTVNDETARAILRLIPDEVLSPTVRERRVRVLNAPALPRGQGVMDCKRSEEWKPDAAGTYRCAPRR